MLAPALAPADEAGDDPYKLGVEYELEKGAHNAWQSSGVALLAGIRVAHRWIDMVELEIQNDREHDNETGERSSERKVGLRIRKDFPLGEDSKLVLRSLLGHASLGAERYAYYYVEPSFRYSVGPVELMAGYRLTRGIDAGSEHDLHKLRLGPSIDLGERSEIELRWARSWNMHTGQHVSDAYIAEYTWRF